LLRLQIGDDVGAFVGIRNALKRERHDRGREQRLRIGDPAVDMRLGPDIALVTELLHARRVGETLDGRGLAPDDAVELGAHQRLCVGAYLMTDAAFGGERRLARLGVTRREGRRRHAEKHRHTQPNETRLPHLHAP
jgi:hypothetical protein